MKVAILGGGITGISLATLLERQGVDYQLFEAAPRVGGLCRSEVVDGFVADVAGGHIIFSKYSDVMEFIFEALGRDGVQETVRKSAIYYKGAYAKYPFENGLGDLPKQDNFECLAGYVEAAFARRNGAAEPENFKDWCLWRFGEGICKHFMHPYNEKIWNVPLEELSNRWVSGRIPDAPIEDVIRSSIGIDTEGYKHQSTFYYPLEGGFETLVKRLAERLDQDRIHVGTRIHALEKTETGYLVDGEPYDRVVSTIPLAELKKLLSDLPDPVAKAFDGLDYTSIASVLVAIDAPETTDRSWIYFPHPETGPFNRVTHLSNYSVGNAPEGKSSLLAEVTYRGSLDVGEDFQKSIVKNLADCGMLKEEQVLFTKVWTNKYAYILYTHDLEANLEVVRQHLGSVDIDILGRFGNYNYYNSDQCIKAVMDYAKTFPRS